MAGSQGEHPEDHKAGYVVMIPDHLRHKARRGRRGQTVPVSDVTRCRLRRRVRPRHGAGFRTQFLWL